MAKSRRNRRATNKIEGTSEATPIEADGSSETALVVRQSQTVRLARTTLLSAELEAVIEIIAKDRVYRDLLDRLGRRLLSYSKQNGDQPTP